MATSSIASLSPSEPPPADQSIRAIVSLLWPYSSSTKQCAFLLAEPDFRSRSHRGQIRVRFQGASAQAVAKGQIGIGDEVVLELRGASWAAESSNVVTPGKSVEGELLFRRELALRLVKKADGLEAGVSINVSETTPPPEEHDVNTTPARPIPSYLRAGLGRADAVPIYSSPAFVSRMRLSGGDNTSWDPFADVDRELEAELANPRKKQRISFGGDLKWKFAGRTPSPEKEDVPMTTVVAEPDNQVAAAEVQSALVHTLDHEDDTQTSRQATSEPETLADQPAVATNSTRSSVMAPPPLPHLEMPFQSTLPGILNQPQTSSDPDTGPHTPKLQPVPSSALPLPSPFPAEAKQLHIEASSATTAANERENVRLAAGPIPNGKDAEAIERSGHVPLRTEASQDLLNAVEEDDDEDEYHQPILPGQPSFSSSVASTVPPEQASGVFRDSRSDYNDDDDNDSDDQYEDSNAQRHRVPHPEYGSDTEEDEEMYSQYTQQRDAGLEQAASDHEDPDNGDQVDADDIEEVIEDMGEPPDSDDSDEGEASGASSQLAESDDNDLEDIDDQPRIRSALVGLSSDPVDAPLESGPDRAQPDETEQSVPVVQDFSGASAPSAKSITGDNTIKLSQVGNALSSTFAEVPETRSAAQVPIHTPARPPPGLFSLDGTADSLRVRTSTPQSERDRIMKKTYSSLFGFAKSPSPEKTQPPLLDFGTPTPASSSNGLSRIAKDRFAAAGLSVEETSLEKQPILSHAKIEGIQSPAATTATSATETPLKEMSVPARATVADTQTLRSDAAASVTSPQPKQMPVPTRATVQDTQSTSDKSFAKTDGVENDGGTISKSVMKDDAANAFEESNAATEETGQSLPLCDVDDGSLLEAVHNAAPKIHEQDEQDKVLVERSPMVEETPIDRLQEAEAQETPEQGRRQAEDSVPDGVAINPSLAAAMATKPDDTALAGGSTMEVPASSAPRPSQVEVIDLGDSSDADEDTQDTKPIQESTVQPSQSANHMASTASDQDIGGNVDAEATTRQQDFERLLSQAEAPRQHGQESVTQISQGSMLQSDMLDTTQTTVDGRSEIATPDMDEYDTIVPDTSHDESMGVFQGQPNFFDDQMHGQEFEGNAAPQLTQQTDRFNYDLSFQSTTSIATDNSDHHQGITTQREGVAESGQETLSEQDDSRGIGSQGTVREAGSPSTALANTEQQVVSLPSAPIHEMPQDQPMSDGTGNEHHAQGSEPRAGRSTHDVKMHDGELRSSFVGETLAQYPQRQPDVVLGSSFESLQSTAVPSEDFATDVRSLREAAQLAESQLPVSQRSSSEQSLTPTADTTRQHEHRSSHHAGSHSALPISPEDSQHRLESQPFETQLPFESVQSALPSTPQLTQGDSLTGQDIAVIVDPATGDTDAARADEAPPTSPRQTRSSQRGALVEGLQSSGKKSSTRKSSRKSQAQSQDMREGGVEEASSAVPHKPITRQSSLDRPITPPPHKQRSQETALKKNMLSPETKMPVRRSPRKAQTQPESQEVADARSIAASDVIEYSTDHKSAVSVETAHVTRSSKKVAKTTSRSQGTTRDPEDEVAVQSTSAHIDDSPLPKTPARRSMTSRISAVPAVISNWFSPRRSTRLEPDPEPEAEAEIEDDMEAEVKQGKDEVEIETKPSPRRRKSNGVVTNLSYYMPLSSISDKLNTSSQTYGSNTLDVMAVVVDETSKPQRAKSGPRDHFTIFKITDPSLDTGSSTSVEVFKHWHATLPSAQVGDVILLRSFLVKSKKRQPYLLSGDESAWCVWRYTEGEPSSTMSSSQKGTPTKAKRMRDRNGSFSIEIKGPPVEYNRPQELQRAEELRAWWLEAQGGPDAAANADADPDGVPASQGSGRKTRSQQKL
ncbi:hypothetical protein CLAFUW4_07414 [Fulvia fulva]|uniref:Telomeric single stranded DNA binding POT1/Cdc13 domain-containing protein n=1 Tax=Passalora fulva TaxID=5499 RepID=A0A9Q8LJH5_PASFU|nr:uncharacterized protein CLAFUR5_07544 [Fulvia fulva]KAK4621645.1 hypothetical protein CLAFUR4_07421 [Fulvia fulva]KAK4622745.1 hypothetical protein CLAFUR0_07420 [Fulvia fulva]UJO18566.1 hypothetical protein CLAFUR5_07544 [Fulvia fulva]WPV16228.1 hypothetical protein CLAFUW4_07414 [Fulvia fulva]WPV31746.1 hypothetical protein CLAFUW7_07417 [Fulvia fulva]